MSLNFPTSAYLTGTANYTLPNADWCMAVLVRVDDNSGPQFNTFLSFGNTIGTDEMSFGLLEDGRASSPRCVNLRIGDGTNFRVLITPTQMSLSTWVLCVAQRSGTEKQVWMGNLGTVPVKEVFQTAALGACAPATPMMIARRHSAQTADHNLLGRMAYYARGDFALSIGQLTALGAGACPRQVAPWAEYLPFFGDGLSTYKSPIGGQTYSMTGSPATDGQPVRLW